MRFIRWRLRAESGDKLWEQRSGTGNVWWNVPANGQSDAYSVGRMTERAEDAKTHDCVTKMLPCWISSSTLQPPWLCFCLIVCEKGPAGFWYPRFHQLYSLLLTVIFSQISAPCSLSSPSFLTLTLTAPSHAEEGGGTPQTGPLTEIEHTDSTVGQIRQADMKIDRQPIGQQLESWANLQKASNTIYALVYQSV